MNHSTTLTRPGRHVPALAALLAVAALGSLTGCSNAGATTCDQYAGKAYSDRHSTSKALLEEHDLEPNSVGNTVGLIKALDSYCGLSGGLQPGTASRNGSRPLSDAVNWSAKNW
jgi:hypothetical protein